MQERFHTFTVLIAKVSRNIRRIKTEAMLEFNLKCPHVSCLYYLYKEGGLTASELCDICDEDKSAVSRSLEHLESEGYIKKEELNGKVYKTPLYLTPKGIAVAEKLSKKIDLVLSKSSEGLSEEERKIFYKHLTLICDNLQNISTDN